VSQRLTADALPKVTAALRAVEGLGELSELDAQRYADEYLSFGSATSGRDWRNKLDEALKKLKDEGVLLADEKEDSCHVYVDFRRRFGGDRAVCLR
jgi:hypothetical protein